MTPQEVLNLVVSLERDLADFYQEIGRKERLKPFADIFSFMTDHSANHAVRIEERAAAIELPTLNTWPMKELHQRLKTSLREQIEAEEDPQSVLRKLAQTEEIVGQLYQSLADHYRHLAKTYTDIADQFETLSREEFHHRDVILEEGP
ncbi:MAG: ferritin family protein [Desulfobacterales bacterium]